MNNGEEMEAIALRWIDLGADREAMVCLADLHGLADPGDIWDYAMRVRMVEWSPGHGRWRLRKGWRPKHDERRH